MPAFRGYGRLALRAAGALGAAALVGLGETTGWLHLRAALAIDWACGLYVLYRVGSAQIGRAHV